MLDLFAGKLPEDEGDETPSADPLAALTPRERDVFVAVAEGLTNSEIAEKLFVSETTVKTHVGNILTKLALRDRVHVVVWAYEHGLVKPGEGGTPLV
jgi:DNA-binding NarL/FixJ family response regulator